MIDLFKNEFWYIIEGACTVLLHMLKYVPGAQEAYDDEVIRHYRLLLEIYLLLMSGLFFISDHLKTQEMCNEEVDIEPRLLALVPDHLKTEEICNKAVRRKLYTLRYVPDWFVTQEQLKIWHDDDEDKFFVWYDGYKKRKAQKVKIKEGLLPVGWHPSRWWD